MNRRIDGLTVIFDMANVGTSMLWRPGKFTFNLIDTFHQMFH